MRDGRTSLICRLPTALVFLATAALATRLFLTISRYGLNILVMDLWAVTTPIFRHAGPIALFRWQHGPHRQGLGEWLIAALFAATHWNVRVLCFAQGTIVTLACLAMLWLRRRLWGPFRYTDVAIPVLFLTLAQWETLVGIPNPSYVALPLLLVILYCAVWLIPRRAARYAIVLALDLLATFTGMGLFLGVLTPALLACDLAQSRRKPAEARRPIAISAAAGIALSILILGLFLIGYDFGRTEPAQHTWRPGPLQYVKFVCVMLATPFGFSLPYLRLAVAAGLFPLLLLVVVALNRGSRYLLKDSPVDRTVAVLALFTLLYCFFAAYGRATIGTAYAFASRYVTCVIPGLLALYLHFLPSARSVADIDTHQQGDRQSLGVRGDSAHAASVAALYGMFRRIYRSTVALVYLATLGPLLPRDSAWLQVQYRQKAVWRQVYLRSGDMQAANAAAGAALDLLPVRDHMQEKLDFLRARRWNLFADDE